MTKKARFIEANPALFPKEKEQVLTFFTKHPNYESRIDWNSKAVSFCEFEKLFKLAKNSARNKKRKQRADPKAMLAEHNCPVIGEADNFLIAVPRDWQAAVFCNSFQCGGQGARWCIGDSRSPEHWESYSEKGRVFYFIYFKKEDTAFGKKIMLEHSMVTDSNWQLYFQNNDEADFSLLAYYLKNIRPMEPDGQSDFDTADYLSRLLRRSVYNPSIEARKYKVRGDRLHNDGPAEAIAAYTRALELEPDYDEAREFRALVYGSNGQNEKAWADWFAIHYPDLQEKPTIKHYLGVIEKYAWALDHVPEKFKTEDFYLAAIRKNYKAFYYIPDEFKTAKLCLAGVVRNGLYIIYVPEELKTAELYLEAVKYSGNNLEYVPEELKTAELCLEAVKRNDHGLKYVPEELKTAELCLEAVNNSGFAFQYVPEEFKTAELCLAKVIRNGNNLEWVSEELKTVELCLAAVKNNIKALEYVPEKLKAEVLIAGAKENGLFLEDVPEKFKTLELCLAAVKNNDIAFKYVPENLKTAGLYIEAVRKDSPFQIFFEY